MKHQLSASHKQVIEERAWAMRHAPTPSEVALWRYLSGKQLGVAFKRQQRIGKYIVDFVAPAVKLVVGVDGGYHAARAAADARRDRFLLKLGYSVLHVDAQEVLQSAPQVAEAIREAVLAASR